MSDLSSDLSTVTGGRAGSSSSRMGTIAARHSALRDTGIFDDVLARWRVVTGAGRTSTSASRAAASLSFTSLSTASWNSWATGTGGGSRWGDLRRQSVRRLGRRRQLPAVDHGGLQRNHSRGEGGRGGHRGIDLSSIIGWVGGILSSPSAAEGGEVRPAPSATADAGAVAVRTVASRGVGRSLRDRVREARKRKTRRAKGFLDPVVVIGRLSCRREGPPPRKGTETPLSSSLAVGGAQEDDPSPS